MPERTRALLLVIVLAAVVAACGEPSSVSWRNVTVQVPDGWYVFEQQEDRLALSSEDIGPMPDGGAREAPDVPVVAVFFSYEPGTAPDDWRRLIEEQDGTIESDSQLMLDDGEVPATRLVYHYTTAGAPTREMVVLIPSRAIVVLAQPVPLPGDTDAPDVFLDHVDTFLEILENAEFGAPVLD